MAFQIKNFVSIAAAMINHMRGTQTAVTDFNVGSVARTMIEAPAIEIDELYQQMFNGLKDAIATATYTSFNFTLLNGVASNGNLTLSITAQTTATTIAAGSVFSSPGASVTYISQQDVTIAAGNTVAAIPVAADTAGIVGNIPSGVAFSVNPSPTGFVSATNAVAFQNGQDQETDAQRKQRFAAFVSTLARSQLPGLEFGAKTAALFDVNGIETERVATASAVEPWVTDSSQPISLVNVYVHNGVGSTSSALISNCSAILHGYTDTNGNKVPGYKSAGVQLVVAAASEVTINVTAALKSDANHVPSALAATAQGIIQSYILGLPIGASYIEAEASFLVMSIPGVVNITGLPADATSTSSQKLMPGTVTVTGS